MRPLRDFLDCPFTNSYIRHLPHSKSITTVTLSSREVSMKVELVTNLKRQATKILADLNLSKEPVLITEHGKPSAYLVDVEDYEFMQRRLELLEGLSRGERAVLEKRIYSQSEAREKLSKWLR